MEIRQIKYFLKVAELLNFSEASRALFITQSTLSQQIGKLEQELDIQLFERNSHEVALTEAGRMLYPHALHVMHAVSDCSQHLQDLREMLTGELNIGVTFSFHTIAHESIMAFLKKFPHVKLNVCYKPMSELMDKLKRRELDIVLAFKPSKPDAHIESRLLFVNHLSAICSENHPLAQKSSLSLDELNRYSLILPAHGLQARHTLDCICAATGTTLRASMDINNVNQLLKIVRESNYVTILSESAIYHEEGLGSVRLDCAAGAMEGCIHILREAYLKRSAQEFITLLADSTSIHNIYSLNYMLGKL